MSIGEVAGHPRAADRAQFRALPRATFDRDRAPGVEGAAGWRADRVRDLAFRRFDLASEAVHLRGRREKHLRIGMLGIFEKGVGCSFLDEAAIYNKALPPGRILAHYIAGRGP